MTYDIQPPESYDAGESLTQEFTIEQPDGSAKDISGATVTWELVPDEGDDSGEAILDDGDSGVSVTIVDGPNGRVDVAIGQDLTTDRGGQRDWQRLTVDDTGDGKQIWSGPFPIGRI